MTKEQFRKANEADIPVIWNILQQAIQKRKEEGSNQWQDGYPNLGSVQSDLAKDAGYVLVLDNEIVGYTAILINDEPAYHQIEGKWLTDGDFVVYHRVAISTNHTGKGLSYKLFSHIENFAKSHKIKSLRADTNHDNTAMLKAFERLGYQYCGEVYFRGSARQAFEKVLE